MTRQSIGTNASATSRWDDDKLNRKESADFLTSYIVKRYAAEATHDFPATLTLNIRADWGFGKTFFLKRWAEDLQEVGYPVVFFDAWANDFTEDPLVGFIAQLEKSLSPHLKRVPLAKRHLDEAIATGRRLIKPVGIAIASAVARKVSGHSLSELSELFSESDGSNESDSGEGGGDSLRADISKLAELALKEHLSKKETIELFKKKLKRVVDSLRGKSSVQLPFFIFVDELDRCRPSYAVELLEAIKHLFGVGGIYFVVATNLEQLGHSIKALYGEGFDSERYLKRFFDQEFMLPTPDGRQFVRFLFSKYSLNSLGTYYLVIEKDLYPNETPEETTFRLFSEAFSLSYRDQEQVALSVQTILLSWPKGERIHFSYLLFLVIIKHKSTAVFKNLVDGSTSDSLRLKNDLAKFANPDVHFRTKHPSNDFGRSEVKEVSILDQIQQYENLRHKSVAELHNIATNSIKYPEKIAHALTHDSPSNWSGGVAPLPPIANYPARVVTIGQLCINHKPG